MINCSITTYLFATTGAMAKTKQRVIISAVIILTFGLLVAAIHGAFLNNTPGIDFYVFYTAGQAFFHHQNPYAPEVTHLIQLGIFRQSAPANYDQMAFAYPPYALFLIYPLTLMEYAWAQAFWMAFNIMLMVSLAYVLFPRASKWVNLTFPFFYPIAFGYILGNYVITVGAAVLVLMRYLVTHKPTRLLDQLFVGVVFAWATIKPQFAWMYLILFFLYCLRERLWTVLAAFVASLGGMMLLSFYFVPDWPFAWLQQLRFYQAYLNRPPALMDYLGRLFPQGIVQPLALTIALIGLGVTLLVFYLWWKNKISPMQMIVWCGLLIFLARIENISYEYMIILVPFYLWAALQQPSLRLTAIWMAVWISSYAFVVLGMTHTLPGLEETVPILLYFGWTIWSFTLATKTPKAALNPL